MPLQDIIISKINNYCGKAIFISKLKDMKFSCNKREQEVLDYSIMYYTLLFNVSIDYENDVIKYQSIRKELLDLLIYKSNEINNQYFQFISFLIELINYENNYVVGLRRLIS